MSAVALAPEQKVEQLTRLPQVSQTNSPENTTTTTTATVTTKKQIVSPLISLAAGAIAGGVEASVTYPFEFAKTRLQLRNQGGSKNPLLMIQHIAKTEGIGGLYTGCSTLVVGTALKASVRFLTYDTVKNTLSDPITGKLNFSRGILAGALAGCVESILAVTPTERIKTALIDDARSSNPRFRSSLHCTRLLLQEQGLSSLYKGLLSTTLKQSATSAVRMGSYNILKQTAQTWDLPTKNAAVTFGMGAIAGTITVYATQPFDTIKTRSQSAKGESTLEAFRGVLKDRDGIRGFWKGSTMRLGRLVLSGGIVFSVYESVVTLLSPGGGNN